MRKLLLIMLMFAVGISASMAQTIRTGAAGNKSAAVSVKPINTQSLTTKSMKDVKMQMAPFALSALNQEKKVISSVTRGDKKIEVLKNADGTYSKRLVSDKSVHKIDRNKTAAANKSASDYTLFESFEDWDGSPNWTPDGWSRNNKTDFTTWDMSEAVDLIFESVYPTDGDYMAWVDWGIDFDDDDDPIFSDTRDEMLISPSFTPVEGDNLYFDVNYAALWMFLDIFEFEIMLTNPVFNLQAFISTDDGATWTTLWDAAADEGYTEDDLWDYDSNEWYSKKISLESYIGKPVKIAFRYTDRDGGDYLGLDNIAVRGSNPTALYMHPQGYFKVGLTPDWGGYSADLLFGHAYDQTIWRNLSTESDAYSWEFDNPDGSNSILKSAEKNPNVPYPFGPLFDIPSLSATAGKSSSTYQWGTEDTRLLIPGGELAPRFGGETPSCGNYDLSYKFYSYYDQSGDYYFGTTSDNFIEGVANYFEKPVHKYMLDGVWAALGDFQGFPAATEFTMVIHRVVDGYLTDEIATATCTPADVKSIAATAFTMPFNSFKTIDPETGLEVESDYLEIEDAIVIEIKGFNNIPGSSISFCVQEFNSDPTGNNYAYLFLDDGRFTHYNASTSLLFNLDIVYSYLFADSDEFIAPAAGGEKTFEVISYYSPDDWWLEEDLPEWVSANVDFDEKTWDIQLNLVAQPLPAGMTSREATVKIATYGADMSILVKQGSGTGLSVITIADTKVINKGNHFELGYSSDYSAISVYNIAGQKIAAYQLPATGTFIVPADNYTKGIYLFSFTGANGVSTVKVRY